MIRRGRIKHGVRAAIRRCGGIDATAEALSYSPSHVGRWNNQADRDLPGLEQALDLDDLALSCGGEAEILRAMAAVLNHVVFRMPEATGSSREITLQLTRATSEVGDVARAVVEAIGDDDVDPAEAGLIIAEIDEAMTQFAMMREALVRRQTAAQPEAGGK